MKHRIASLFFIMIIIFYPSTIQAKEVSTNQSETMPIIVMYDDLYNNPDGHILLNSLEIKDLNLFLGKIDKKVKFHLNDIPAGGNNIIVNQKTKNQWKKYIFYDNLLVSIQSEKGQTKFCRITSTEYQEVRSFINPMKISAYFESNLDNDVKAGFYTNSENLIKIYQKLQGLSKSMKYSPDNGNKIKNNFGKDYIKIFMDGPDGFHEVHHI